MGFFPFTPPPVPGSLVTPPLALSQAAPAGGILSVTEQASGPTGPPVQFTGNAAGDRMYAIQVAGDTFERLQVDTNGTMKFGSGAAGADVTLNRASAGLLNVGTADLDVGTAGRGLRVAEGANAKQGTFVLAGAATTTVPNTSVTANSRIILTCQALGTVAAASTLAVSSRVAGTSFTVTPSQATDTSTIAYEIFEPG